MGRCKASKGSSLALLCSPAFGRAEARLSMSSIALVLE